MKYAIAYMNHMVFQHFGKCPSFLLVDIEDEKILKKDMLNVNGSGHGALVALLKDANVDVLVCGGIGQGARNVLAENQIALISGANGNVDEIFFCNMVYDVYIDGICICTGSILYSDL